MAQSYWDSLGDFKLWLEAQERDISFWLDNMSDTAYQANQDVKNEWHQKVQKIVFIEAALKYIDEFIEESDES